MLVEETLRTCAQYLTAACREESEEHRANIFHNLVLRRKLRTAVRWITERKTRGVLQPAELCTKNGERVMELLHTKHPKVCPLAAASLESYSDRPPELLPVDITNDTVTEVAVQLTGGARPGGADPLSLQYCLLHFGASSRELWLIVADFAEWSINGRPPWAAYCATMGGWLIALYNQPGVRPVGVGGNWRQLMAKCLLQVTGKEAKAACCTEKLSGGVETGVDSGVHIMSLL